MIKIGEKKHAEITKHLFGCALSHFGLIISNNYENQLFEMRNFVFFPV